MVIHSCWVQYFAHKSERNWVEATIKPIWLVAPTRQPHYMFPNWGTFSEVNHVDTCTKNNDETNYTITYIEW